MKKITKITALVLTLVMLCMLLCSCASLDLKREEHAIWTNDKSIDSITLSNGETYLKLESKDADKIKFDLYEYYTVYVTEKDVPVLLSNTYGECFQISDDKNFIFGYIEDTNNYFENNNKMKASATLFGSAVYFEPVEIDTLSSSIPHGENVIYCKEELYDDIMEKLENGVEYTHYGYDYFIYDDEQFENKHCNYYLSKDESQVIEKILKDVKPKTNYDTIYNNCYLCTMYHYSDERLFGEYTCDIYISYDEKSYYLACYIDSLDTYDCYKVPEKYLDDIENITKDAKKAIEIIH